MTDAILPADIGTPWLPGVIRVPDDEYKAGRLRLMTRSPKGLLLHSGDAAEHVAEYAEDEGDGRDISYHLAWSKEHQQIVQMVPFTHRAWHAGEDWNHWIGLALSGPWDQDPRREVERQEFIRVVGVLVQVQIQVEWWSRHSIVAPTRKKDPGPGFKDSWMEAIGLNLWTPESA